MKKLLFLPIMLCLVCIGCSSNKTEKLLSEYEVTISAKPECKLNVYTWKNLSQEQFYKNGQTLKGKTDKILGLMPTESHEKEANPSNGEIYTSYVWENTEQRVSLWLDYQEGKEFIQLIITNK